ncbi:ThiF family adenylyltransferase [Devosia sp. PTR5]|uniref:ThiF family adenylyltransferase n=1 Tax=Devosia oryzisoli TaxID=2774138 RepID=A0A927FVE4_9HYPH|nr:ThiF family adenylyltransferase [Devosia oryzisoli]MBD8066042.1 ThiF family adenylyltransferase [Devosia oryzisoli]
MTPNITLAFAGVTHTALKRHLFPGDGNEAAAVLLCSASPGPRDRLIVREVIMVPHADCKRWPDYITWPGSYIEDAIDSAEADGLTIVLLHSHPGGWLDFSSIDDDSDARVIPGLLEALGDRHGSAIMTPDGAVRARLYNRDMNCMPVDLVTVSGDDILYFWNDAIADGLLAPRPLAFTGPMTKELSRLSAAVIGVSGTGSIVAEQLARLGFGQIVLIDYDLVEKKNLNRILNSTTADAAARRPKVEMFADAIETYRGPGVALPIDQTINSRDGVLAAAQCDLLFSCVDSQEGRQILDLVCSAFVMPLFDVGVTIPTHEGNGAVEIIDVCGRVDYVQPGGASLADRDVYTQEGIRAEFLRQTNSEAFEAELADGYIKGIVEEAPSVITLNMRAAAAVATEFLARVYAFRQEPNRHYARTKFSLADCEETYWSEDAFPSERDDLLGRGASEPLLGLPSLAAQRRDAA